ncbi:putative ubiquitin carboxyl-terminal hydrolase 11 [Diplonema papillatum]|nr:putative ubiquitin carboxyl-terminal hydrolase 11 [Diplonema papillatum]
MGVETSRCIIPPDEARQRLGPQRAGQLDRAYRQLTNGCTAKGISVDSFQERFLSSVLPCIPNVLSRALFQALNSRSHGPLGLDDLLSGLAVLYAGTPEERAKLIFHVIDEDRDDRVAHEDVLRFASRCESESMRDIVKTAFPQDVEMTPDRFRRWLLENDDHPELISWIRQFEKSGTSGLSHHHKELIEDRPVDNEQALAAGLGLEQSFFDNLATAHADLRQRSCLGVVEYKTLFTAVTQPICRNMLLSFDKDRSGTVSLRDLVQAAAAWRVGTLKQKLRLCYDLFSLSSDADFVEPAVPAATPSLNHTTPPLVLTIPAEVPKPVEPPCLLPQPAAHSDPVGTPSPANETPPFDAAAVSSGIPKRRIAGILSVILDADDLYNRASGLQLPRRPVPKAILDRVLELPEVVDFECWYTMCSSVSLEVSEFVAAVWHLTCIEIRMKPETRDEEVRLVQRLQAINNVEGLEWCLIDKAWWTAFLDPMEAQPNDASTINQDLLDACANLRQDISEGKDYALLTKGAWRAVEAWYGTQPTIARKAVKRYNGDLEVELYPPTVMVALGNPEEPQSTESMRELTLSSMSTARDVILRMCGELSISATGARLYDKAGLEVLEGSTLEDMNLEDGHFFLLHINPARHPVNTPEMFPNGRINTSFYSNYPFELDGSPSSTTAPAVDSLAYGTKLETFYYTQADVRSSAPARAVVRHLNRPAAAQRRASCSTDDRSASSSDAASSPSSLSTSFFKKRQKDEKPQKKSQNKAAGRKAGLPEASASTSSIEEREPSSSSSTKKRRKQDAKAEKKLLAKKGSKGAKPAVAAQTEEEASAPAVEATTVLVMLINQGIMTTVPVEWITRVLPRIATWDDGDGRVGLQNLGNTCYMAAALQCLSHTRLLREYFLNHADYAFEINTKSTWGMGGKLAVAYAELMENLWCTSERVIAPRRFRNVFGQYRPEYASNRQHDAQEFMLTFLVGLSADITKPYDVPFTQYRDSDGRADRDIADERWHDLMKRESSVVTKLFTMQFKKQVECQACRTINRTFSLESMLSFALATEPTAYQTITVRGPFIPVKLNVKVNEDTTINDVLSVVCHAVNNDPPWVRTDPLPTTTRRPWKPTGPDQKASPQEFLAVQLSADGGVVETFLRSSSRVADVASSAPISVYYLAGHDPDVDSIIQIVHRECVSLGDALRGTVWSPKVYCAPSILSYPSRARDDDVRRQPSRDLKDCSIRSAEQLDYFSASAMNTSTAITISEADLKSRLWPTCCWMMPDFTVQENADGEFPGTEEGEGGARKYPFIITTVTKNGTGCASCAWTTGCLGCVFDGGVGAVSPNTTFAADWDSALLKKFSNDRLLQHFDVHDSFVGAADEEVAKKTKLTLADCLDAFTAVDEAESHCEACAKRRAPPESPSGTPAPTEYTATRKKGSEVFWRLPPVFVVFFKRYNLCGQKIRTCVTVPLEGLDLRPWCADSPEIQNTVYDLYAVINHRGLTHDCGHYFSFILINGRWWRFDDSVVTPMLADAVITPDAYLLMFRRRDPDARRLRAVWPEPDTKQADIMAIKVSFFV